VVAAAVLCAAACVAFAWPVVVDFTVGIATAVDLVAAGIAVLCAPAIVYASFDPADPENIDERNMWVPIIPRSSIKMANAKTDRTNVTYSPLVSATVSL